MVEAQSAKGDYVVLLHGIARSSAQMEELAERFAKEGYEPINIDYPSTDYSLEDLTERLHKQLQARLTQDKPVHFVAFSMGGVLARAYIHKYRPKKLGRVVQLGSPNHGSEVTDFLKENGLYKWFYGPAGQQLTTNNKATEKLLGDVDYDLGIIAGNSTIDPIASYFLFDAENDGRVLVESTKVNGMKDHMTISSSHTFLPGNDEAIAQAVSFLKHSKFEHKTKE
jgi:pimeloyl-ACP methyl ester carboxylesterase